jgi:hypothetical protein
MGEQTDLCIIDSLIWNRQAHISPFFPSFSPLALDGCVSGSYSTLRYIIHRFCLDAFRTSARPLCLLHVKRSLLLLTHAAVVSNFFWVVEYRILYYVISLCFMKYTLLCDKWDDGKHMERKPHSLFCYLSCNIPDGVRKARITSQNMPLPDWISRFRHYETEQD